MEVLVDACVLAAGEANRGHQRALMIIQWSMSHPRVAERQSESNQKQPEAIRSHQEPSEAARSHQKHSEAIRSHRRHLEEDEVAFGVSGHA